MTTPSPNPDDVTTRLNERNVDEWWDVARKVNPAITREQFDNQMTEFETEKRRRLSNDH